MKLLFAIIHAIAIPLELAGHALLCLLLFASEAVTEM